MNAANQIKESARPNPLTLRPVTEDAEFAAAMRVVAGLEDSLGRILLEIGPLRARLLGVRSHARVDSEVLGRAAHLNEREVTIRRELPVAHQLAEIKRRRAAARLAEECPELLAARRRIVAALGELADADDEYGQVIDAFKAAGYGAEAIADIRYSTSGALRWAAGLIAP